MMIMSTKISNGVVKSLIGCLDEITKRNAKLPVKVWYTLSYNRKKLLSADKVTEDSRIKLVEKYGEKNEESQAVSVPQEKMPDFQKEYIELLEIEESLEIRKVPIQQLEDALDMMEGVSGLYNFFEYMVEGEESQAILEPVKEETVES